MWLGAHLCTCIIQVSAQENMSEEELDLLGSEFESEAESNEAGQVLESRIFELEKASLNINTDDLSLLAPFLLSRMFFRCWNKSPL